ncbi:hypothetical protein HDU93_007653, partial [Gonapodya sp. JEL0774]
MAAKHHLTQYWQLGWIAFPISIAWNSNRQKKELQAPKGWQNLDVEAAKALPTRNAMAIQTGSASGIIVLDIDDVDGWRQFLHENDQVEPHTVTARSQSGGIHYYFEWSESVNDLKSTSALLGGCADIRNKGGMIIAPPTSFAVPGETEARTYAWLEGKSPWDCELAQMPDWLALALRERGGGNLGASKREARIQSTGPDSVPTPSVVKEYIAEFYAIMPDNVGDTKWLGDGGGFAVSTKVYDCCFKKAPHKGNKQYLFVSANGDMSRRCHDGDCVDKKWGSRRVPTDIVNAITALFVRIPDVSPEIVQGACQEAVTLVNDVHPGNANVAMVYRPDAHSFQGALDTYFGRKVCPFCEQGKLVAITSREGLAIRCDSAVCGYRSPANGAMPVGMDKYSRLGNFFMVVNVNVTNNNAITTINNFGSDADIPSLFLGDDVMVRPEPELNRLILHALGGSDSTMARLFARLYSGRVAFAGGRWFTFSHNRWREGDESQVMAIMDDPNNSEFVRALYDARAAYTNATMDKDVKEQKLKRIAATIVSSESRHKQSDIAAMCKKPTLLGIADELFLDKLDTNHKLLGFDNGVYDLSSRVFRPGEPGDYVSLSVGYDFVPNKMSDPVTREEVMRFLETVFPDAGVRKYTLLFLASALEGYNKDHRFHFAYGKSGRNGKGILMKIMEMVLGGYMTMVNSTLICGKSADANAATPQLTKMVCKRFVYMSEVEAGARINEEVFQRLCGGDKLVIRPLFKESREVDNMAKILMLCNDMPKIDGSKDSNKPRIAIIPFVSRFIDGPCDPTKHEYPIDTELHMKASQWKHAMMGILLDYHKIYIRDGLKDIPEAMKRAKTQYLGVNDQSRLVDEFVQESLVKGGQGIVTEELISRYRSWEKENG